MHVRWVVALWAAALLAPFAVFPTPVSQSALASSPQSSSSANGRQKYSHANDFLIRGTVFTDKALSFPGVQLRIRRTGEKKFRWEDQTKFLLSGAANAELHTWEGKSLIGEDSAADQEVIRMAVFLPAICG